MNQLHKAIKTAVPCYNMLVMNERFYGRWMHRHPAKVILPYEGSSMRKEKVIELGSKDLLKSKELCNLKNETKSETPITECAKLAPERSKEIIQKRETKILNHKNKIKTLNVFDEDNELIYKKLNENDGRISSLLINLKSKKERAKMGQVLVEGWRLIKDGLEAKCKLTHIVFSRTEDLDKLKPFLPKTGVMIYKMPYKEIRLWSDVETSPGIMGIFESPTPDKITHLWEPLPINIVCDNIRIPGNLGAILRSAVGVGCKKVFLMKGCVDLWDPKVVRSAAGAHFRLPVHSSVHWDQLTTLIDPESSIFIADNNSKPILNTDIPKDEDIMGSLDELEIPVLPYYSVDYSSLESVTLVIGGETDGISNECYRFTAARQGLRLNIPLQKGVDSLNSAMATTVIAFEIKKQLLQAKAKLFLNSNNNVIEDINIANKQ